MDRKKPTPSETERMARVITKCFSRTAIEVAAVAMDVPISTKTDIFRALILCGKAADFDEAVSITARYLDAHSAASKDADGDLIDGKIERRRQPRAR